MLRIIIIITVIYPNVYLITTSKRYNKIIGIISLILLAVALFHQLPVHAAYANDPTTDKYDIETSYIPPLYSSINSYRAGLRLPTLKRDQHLYELAQIYARELCQDIYLKTTNTGHPYISHVRAD